MESYKRHLTARELAHELAKLWDYDMITFSSDRKKEKVVVTLEFEGGKELAFMFDESNSMLHLSTLMVDWFVDEDEFFHTYSFRNPRKELAERLTAFVTELAGNFSKEVEV